MQATRSPALQLKTIRNHHGPRRADQSRARSKRYEDYVDKTLSGEPSELRLSAHRARPRRRQPTRSRCWSAAQSMTPPRRPNTSVIFDQVYGPGAAELELARLERALPQAGSIMASNNPFAEDYDPRLPVQAPVPTAGAPSVPISRGNPFEEGQVVERPRQPGDVDRQRR